MSIFFSQLLVNIRITYLFVIINFDLKKHLISIVFVSYRDCELTWSNNMKDLSLYCILMILTLSVNSSLNVAFAGLIDRGNGMIYDDVQDITWLQDANLAGKNMTWYESMAWAEN